MAPALAAVRALPGVRTAVWTPALGGARRRPIRCCRAMRAGHVPERSGDITLGPGAVLDLRPRHGIPNGGNATTHGSSNDYDQHVPLVFLGAPFAPGRVRTRRHAGRCRADTRRHGGLPMPGVEGRALDEAAARSAQ